MASQRTTSARPTPATSDPGPEPTSPRRPSLPMFQSPQDDPPLPADPEPAPDEAWGSPDPEPSDLPEPSAAPRSSSTGSSGGSPVSKRAVRDAARQAVLMAGGIAHQVLARDEAARTVELYATDEADAEAIGDPVANMVNRRGGIGAAGNPDLADAIAALIGLALYVVKQLARWNAARDLRAEARTGLAEPGSLPTGPVDLAPAAFAPQEG